MHEQPWTLLRPTNIVEHDDHVTFGDDPSHVSLKVRKGAHETRARGHHRSIGRELVEGVEIVPVHHPIDQIERPSLVPFTGHGTQSALIEDRMHALRLVRSVAGAGGLVSRMACRLRVGFGDPFSRGWDDGLVTMVLRDDGSTDWGEVKEILTESYCLLAPKKLIALLGAARPRRDVVARIAGSARRLTATSR